MAAITLNILKPSVNNLTVRIFVRAAKLDFEEVRTAACTAVTETVTQLPHRKVSKKSRRTRVLCL